MLCLHLHIILRTVHVTVCLDVITINANYPSPKKYQTIPFTQSTVVDFDKSNVSLYSPPPHSLTNFLNFLNFLSGITILSKSNLV